MKKELPEHRCPKCGKLLYKGEVMRLEIKCPRCRKVVYHEILDLQQAVKEHGNRS